VGRRKEIGFLVAVVDEWIGLDPVEPVAASACGSCDGDAPPARVLVPLGLTRRG